MKTAWVQLADDFVFAIVSVVVFACDALDDARTRGRSRRLVIDHAEQPTADSDLST